MRSRTARSRSDISIAVRLAPTLSLTTPNSVTTAPIMISVITSATSISISVKGAAAERGAIQQRAWQVSQRHAPGQWGSDDSWPSRFREVQRPVCSLPTAGPGMRPEA